MKRQGAKDSLLSGHIMTPSEIEARSLAAVEALCRPFLPPGAPEREVALRMVHAQGDPQLAPLLRFHPQAIPSALGALRAGGAVIVDVLMVKVGLDQKALRRLGCRVYCAISQAKVARRAREEGVPRAVAAMQALAPHMDGALVVVGCAPTALLAVLDLIDQGVVGPACIIGVPVGFVAAAEAKEELALRSVPYITLQGSRGGSALAVAAVNALLRQALLTSEGL